MYPCEGTHTRLSVGCVGLSVGVGMGVGVAGGVGVGGVLHVHIFGILTDAHHIDVLHRSFDSWPILGRPHICIQLKNFTEHLVARRKRSVANSDVRFHITWRNRQWAFEEDLVLFKRLQMRFIQIPGWFQSFDMDMQRECKRRQ